MGQHSHRRAFWRSHYDRCRKRGMTLKDYAEQEGLTLSVFYGWSQRFRKEQPGSASFHRVQVTQAAPTDYRLHLPNGLILEWRGEAAPAQLISLVKALI